MPLQKGLVNKASRPLSDIEYVAKGGSGDPYAMIEARKALYEHRLRMLRQQYEKELKEYEAITSKLEKIYSELEELKKKIESGEGAYEDLKRKYNELLEKAKALEKILEEKKAKLEELGSKLGSLKQEYEQKKSIYEQKLERIKAKAERLKKIYSMLADNVLTQEELRRLKELGYDVSDPSKIVEQYNREVIEFRKELAEARKLYLEVHGLASELFELSNTYNKLYKEYTALIPTYRQLGLKLKALYDVLSTKKSELEQLIGSYRAKAEQAKALKKLAEKEYQDLVKVAEEYNKLGIKAERALKQYIEKAEFWEENLRNYEFKKNVQEQLDKIAKQVFEYEIAPPNLTLKKWSEKLSETIQKERILQEKTLLDYYETQLKRWSSIQDKIVQEMKARGTKADNKMLEIDPLGGHVVGATHYREREARAREVAEQIEQAVYTPATWLQGVAEKSLTLGRRLLSENNVATRLLGIYVTAQAGMASATKGFYTSIASFVTPWRYLDYLKPETWIGLKKKLTEGEPENIALAWGELAGSITSGIVLGKVGGKLVEKAMAKKGYVRVEELALKPRIEARNVKFTETSTVVRRLVSYDVLAKKTYWEKLPLKQYVKAKVGPEVSYGKFVSRNVVGRFFSEPWAKGTQLFFRKGNKVIEASKIVFNKGVKGIEEAWYTSITGPVKVTRLSKATARPILASLPKSKVNIDLVLGNVDKVKFVAETHTYPVLLPIISSSRETNTKSETHTRDSHGVSAKSIVEMQTLKPKTITPPKLSTPKTDIDFNYDRIELPKQIEANIKKFLSGHSPVVETIPKSTTDIGEFLESKPEPVRDVLPPTPDERIEKFLGELKIVMPPTPRHEPKLRPTPIPPIVEPKPKPRIPIPSPVIPKPRPKPPKVNYTPIEMPEYKPENIEEPVIEPVEEPSIEEFTNQDIASAEEPGKPPESASKLFRESSRPPKLRLPKPKRSRKPSIRRRRRKRRYEERINPFNIELW